MIVTHLNLKQSIATVSIASLHPHSVKLGYRTAWRKQDCTHILELVIKKQRCNLHIFLLGEFIARSIHQSNLPIFIFLCSLLYTVQDTDNGKKSNPVSVTTDDFTPVDVTTVSSFAVGDVILAEATLSFLGLGVKYPMATWGAIS